MGFMQSYKRLDTLCRDMNGIGVTGYIEDMEQVRNGDLYVPGWKTDYRQLKHYRYIRNQIAHENYATEETMCSLGDIEWVEKFFQRILKQTDPLAVYYRAIKPPKKTVSTKASVPQTMQPSLTHTDKTGPKTAATRTVRFVVAVVILLALIALIWGTIQI